MSKTVSANLNSHLAEAVTKLATCWKIKRNDGTIFAYTDHDSSLTVNVDSDGDQTYKPTNAYMRTAVSTKSDMNVDNLDTEAIMDDNDISEDDLRVGLFNGAEIKVFVVRWDSIADGIIKLRRGWLGEVTLHDDSFQSELRGLMQLMQQDVTEMFSRTCRAEFGDTRCGVSLAALAESCTVDTVVSDRRTFRVTGLVSKANNEPWSWGYVTFTSGLNNGLTFEVVGFSEIGGSPLVHEISLFIKADYTISASDTLEITPGCNKALETCRDEYSNLDNFRGEPYVPNEDTNLAINKA